MPRALFVCTQLTVERNGLRKLTYVHSFVLGVKCKASIYCEKTVKGGKIAEPGIFKEDSTKQSTVKALKIVFTWLSS